MLSRFIDKLKRNGRGRNDKEAGRNHRRRKKERNGERGEREREGRDFGRGNYVFVSAHIHTAIEFGSERKSNSFCWG